MADKSVMVGATTGDWESARADAAAAFCWTLAVESCAFVLCDSCSLSFFLYFSLSFRARSRSDFNPNIMVRCFSMIRHIWSVWAATDCFSRSSLIIAASAEPADWIRVAMSCGVLVSFGTLRECLKCCEVEEESEELVESSEAVR